MTADDVSGERSTLGILGGMGPRASARFLDTLYRTAYRQEVPEQSDPRCVLPSDPSVADRTERLEAGRRVDGVACLQTGLNRLESAECVLVLATRGTMRSKTLAPLFDRPHAARLVLPTADEQARVHELIYGLRRGSTVGDGARVVEELAREHRAGDVVAGCTEVHLLSEGLVAPGVAVINPLLTLVERPAGRC